jgi:hypothetical protein
MQKHKFGVTSPVALFVESGGSQMGRKNSASMFCVPTLWKALCDPQVPLDAQHKFGVTCPNALFFESVQIPPKHEK